MHLVVLDAKELADVLESKHEIDFMLRRRGRAPDAIECKWSADCFDVRNLRAFRRRYPDDHNWVVAADIDRPFARNVKGLDIRYVSLSKVIEEI